MFRSYSYNEKPIYDFRSDNPEFVRVAKKTDASVQRQGKIAFAVRTSALAS